MEASNWVMRCDSHPAMLAAARAGLGIAIAQIPTIKTDPRLQILLPDLELPRLDTWVVTHEDLRHVPKVRALFDRLVEGFKTYR